VGLMVGIAALAQPKKPALTALDWAGKSSLDAPPAAVLVELGLKDDKPIPWTGKATVTGARVVHREGYRFRPQQDKLVDPDGWEASSHWALRAPKGMPAVTRQEGVATVGVVLHLTDVKDNATLTIEPRPASEDKPAKVKLKDVLAGKPQPLWDGEAVVRLVSTASPLVTAKTEDDCPAACYGPDGTLWVAYVSYTLKEEGRRVEAANLKEQPENFKAFYTPEFGDQLFVKFHKDGKWSDPVAVTDPNQDLVRCAVACDGDGVAHVLYSVNHKGRYELCLRTVTPAKDAPTLGQEKVLSQKQHETPALTPVACTASDGSVRVGFQENFNTGYVHLKGGEVVGAGGVASTEHDHWGHAIAAGPNGALALAYDQYADGDYDVVVQKDPITPNNEVPVATSSKFEARPSLAYDLQGRLWIAYEEGPQRWGKDYGALVPGEGEPLYSSRSVRVVCLQDGKLFKPAAELPTSDIKAPTIPLGGQAGPKYERTARYAYPKLGIDGKGRLWLTYRQKFGTRYSTHPGSYWLSFARLLEGDHWSEPIELHHSDGLLDYRPVLLPHKAGGLLVVHNTDGRYTTPETIDNQIYTSYVDLPGDPVEPKLVPAEPGKKDAKLVERQKKEAEASKRLRGYRVEAGGKKYQPLRGEFHRHTEISWDGGPDGSLEDMFRYAVDAIQFDWIGNGDHDSGGGREYSWWLIQKYSDAYRTSSVNGGQFTPMFTYERSVNYPHGHRNCMFARRGVRTLPRLAEPDMEKRVGGVNADDTKMLYRYLKEMGGVCAGHTSATSMGTDWRDNDPEVEPFVEIYQGDRMSYEMEEAPRAGYDPKTNKEPANIAGWYPDGFIDNALGKKGYKLGFESSSDHWSTHISYCVVLAEEHTREAILAAIKKRHVYGATDEIVLDVRSGEHLMGEELKTGKAPTLDLHVVGTGELAGVEILRDSKVVETIKPGKAEYKATWTDPKPEAGVHYYYVRVQQADKELAWSSPLWIDFAP
jgi:hypothetical protein